MTGYIRGKQLRELTGLSESNLKRYYELLELHGYIFTRNNRGHRIYNSEDVKVFQAMIHLNKEKNMSLDEATSFICSKGINIEDVLADTKNDSQNRQELMSFTGVPSEVPSELTVKMLVEIYEMQVAYISNFEQLQEENKELKEQLSRFETKIDERDHFINQILEKMDQQSATIENKMDTHYRELRQKQFEQIERLKQQEKSGFFNRLFRK